MTKLLLTQLFDLLLRTELLLTQLFNLLLALQPAQPLLLLLLEHAIAVERKRARRTILRRL